MRRLYCGAAEAVIIMNNEGAVSASVSSIMGSQKALSLESWHAAGLRNVYMIGPEAPYPEFSESFSVHDQRYFHRAADKTEAQGWRGLDLCAPAGLPCSVPCP